MSLDILYQDFDGCLHPFPLIVKRRRRARTEPEYFESCDILLEAMRPYPDVKLVLSTSWAITYGVDRAARNLPKELASSVTSLFSCAFSSFSGSSFWLSSRSRWISSSESATRAASSAFRLCKSRAFLTASCTAILY
jgi:hypothetical protein